MCIKETTVNTGNSVVNSLRGKNVHNFEIFEPTPRLSATGSAINVSSVKGVAS